LLLLEASRENPSRQSLGRQVIVIAAMSEKEGKDAAAGSPPAPDDAAESEEDEEVKITNSNENGDDDDDEEEEEEGVDDGDDEEEEEGDDDDDDVGLRGEDIARVMQSKGPVVIKCVLLKHLRSDGKDGKPHPTSPHADGTHHRVVLVEDIEEVQIDVTPEKTHIQELLGGPFTFLGQYEEEGTVVIARKDLPDNLAELPVKQLRELCRDHSVDTSSVVEKADLVDALWATQLPHNPHQLQPPLDKVRVRGDILLMRVAKTDEALDDDNDEENAEDGSAKDKKKAAHQKLRVLPNDEFFLDYSKEEYVNFASRTDVRAPEPADDDEEGEEDDDDDEEEDDDEDYDPSMEDEEEKQAMLNLVMGEVLRKFREEHGRGPDTRELLEIRGHVASQLDVEVATLEALEASAAAAEASAKKRKKGKGEEGADGEADDDGDDGKPSKHVKFQASLKRDDSEDGDGDEEGESKPKAIDGKAPSKKGNGETCSTSD
jgi:Family of unknown function (DUF5880)